MLDCQAAVMDAEFFGSIEPVPPCREVGKVDVRGYLLCAECHRALTVLVGMGRVALKRIELN